MSCWRLRCIARAEPLHKSLSLSLDAPLLIQLSSHPLVLASQIETKIMRECDHPGVVKCYEAAETDGQVCLFLSSEPYNPNPYILNPAPYPWRRSASFSS